MMGSPRIINVSADFKDTHKSTFTGLSRNSYQKMVKNKRLLHRGRFSEGCSFVISR